MARDRTGSGTGTAAPARCQGQKADGSPCESPFVGEGGWCPSHGPQGSERMRARGRKGAESKHRTNGKRSKVRVADPDSVPDKLETVEDAVAWAGWAVKAVATGMIDSRTAHEVGFLCRAFMDGRRHLDRTDERIKTVEKKLAKLKGEK